MHLNRHLISNFLKASNLRPIKQIKVENNTESFQTKLKTQRIKRQKRVSKSKPISTFRRTQRLGTITPTNSHRQKFAETPNPSTDDKS